MADSPIQNLPTIFQISPQDHFVLEHSEEAFNLTGQTLINWLTSFSKGLGGIRLIQKTGTAGLVDTYTIFFANDSQKSTFDVTNGESGVYYGSSEPAPSQFVWVNPEGTLDGKIPIFSVRNRDAGDWTGIPVMQGGPATLTSQTVEFQFGESGTEAPAGVWIPTPPATKKGLWLWIRVTQQFSKGDPVRILFPVYQGIDGEGEVGSVCGVPPDPRTRDIDLAEYLKKFMNDNFKELNLKINHPIGSWYVSDDPTDPSVLFGGVWQRYTNIFLYAADDMPDSGYNVGNTGGETEHTLTIEEMPKHQHDIRNPHEEGSVNKYVAISPTISAGPKDETWNWRPTDPTGGGQPHNNMPPYYCTYMWKRTA